MPTIPAWLAGMSVTDVAITIVFAVALFIGARKLLRGVAAWKDRWDDVFGEPARPGVEARPSLREELASVKVVAVQAAKDAAEASKNTKPNGGSSSHDRVMHELGVIRDRQSATDTRLANHITATDRSIGEVMETLKTQGALVGPLVEALPIVARSTPPTEEA